MRDAVLYIAVSLDGYIADQNGGVDWLGNLEKECEKDRGYENFLESVDTVIMGYNTYLQICLLYTSMCPSSVMWQDLQCELVDKVYNELGMDGVYLDQIAAAKPNLCADPHHNHAAGGGSWWIENYNHMASRMKTHGPETGAFVTECTGEAYMKSIEALLSWAWVRNSQVPAFSAVYGGRVALRCV